MSTATVPAASLRIVPKAPKPWPPIGDGMGRAIHALGLLEGRWLSCSGRRRYATRRMARRAIHELIELVALVGLHLPLSTRRDRQAQRQIVDPVLAAMEQACGCRSCRRSQAATGGAS